VYSEHKFTRRTWHHIALTFERTDRAQFFDPESARTSHRLGKLYVNGELEASFETRLFDLTRPTLIAGAEYSQYAKQRFFTGLMDELRIYGSTLTALDAGELSFTEVKSELAQRGLVWRASFGDYQGSPRDIHDKVVKGRNRANPKESEFEVEIAYCDDVHATAMPFQVIPILTPTRPTLHTPDPTISGVSGPLRGSTVEVAGANFAQSRFFRVEMSLLPEGEWMPITFTPVDVTHIRVHMPEMTYTGSPIDVAVRVSNGGTAYPGINFQTFAFTYDYSLGEDWQAGLTAAYTFDQKSFRATDSAWDNVVDRDNATIRATRMANYGVGGPFQTADRNYLDDRGIAFSMGERVSLPPLAPGNWSMCTWLYARAGSEVLFHETDTSGLHSRNVFALDAMGGVHLDGVSFNASIRLHAWQFVCVSREGASLPATLYVSGQAVGTANPLTPSLTVHHAVLGKMLDGMVDDLWVWSRDLKSHEPNDMYTWDRRSITLSGASTSYFTAETSTGVFDSTALAPAFSVQMWIKPVALNGVQPLMQVPTPVSATTTGSDAAALSHGIYVGLVDGHILAQLPLDNNNIGGATTWGNAITEIGVLIPGEWAHVTVVFTSASKLSIYVDGVKQLLLPATQAADNLVGNYSPNTNSVLSVVQPPGSATFVGGLYVSPTGDPLRIGFAEAQSLSGMSTAYFRGSIAEFRLWSLGLSDAQVASTFGCTPQASEFGLYASFLIDESLGSSLISGAEAQAVSLTYSGPQLPFWEYAAYGTVANTTVWTESEVDGAGASHATAGVGGHFTFQDRSTCRLLKKTGGDEVQVALVGPMERRPCNQFGSCLDHLDGTYTCAYNLTLCGTYSLRVEDASGLVEAGVYSSWTSTSELLPDPTQEFLRMAPDTSVAGGATTLLVLRPGPTYAPKSFVYDEPDWLVGTDMYVAHKGVPAAFMLRAADHWGCPRSVGGDDWEVSTFGRHSTEGWVNDLGDGRYKITYTPHIEGRTQLSVTLDSVHVDTDNGYEQGAIHTWNAHEDRRIGYTGSPWCVEVLPGNGSLVFDGLNYATVPHSEGLSLDYEDWSVDAWVMVPAGRRARGKIFSKASARTGQGYHFGFAESDGKLDVSLYVGGGETRAVRSEKGVSGGKWVHVSASYTGDALRLYINGAQVGEGTWDSAKTVRENSQEFIIGRGFVGHLDELRIFKQEVASELSAEGRLARCPAPRQQLAAYFSFNDGSASATVHDYVSHTLEGTMVGYNALNSSNVFIDPEFDPAWSDMRAPSDYGVVDFAASVASHFSGGGLVSAVAGIPTTFAFTFWDRCGFDIVSDAAAVSAAMVEEVCENTAHDALTYPFESEDAVGAIATVATVAQCTASTAFVTTYTAPKCGTIRLRAMLESNIVDGFPIDLEVSPHPAPSAKMSEVTALGAGVAGVSTTFTIVARDEFGCQRTSGGDVFEVLLTRTTLGHNPEGLPFGGPDVVAQNLPAVDNGDGSYSVTVHPPAAGNYTLAVGLLQPDGTRAALRGSPLPFVADSPPWRAVHVEGERPGPRYKSTSVKSGDHVFVFRGWSTDKEGMVDVWRYPLSASEAWRYRVAVTVTNPPPHAVAVTVNTAALITAGKMRADCGDAMFKAVGASDWEDAVVPHWIDVTPGCNASSTLFWVVPPASGRLYMFYGNPQAVPEPQLNPSDIFPVWATFEGDAIDSDTGLPLNWTFANTCWLPRGDPATFSVSGSPLKVWRGGASLQVDANARVGGALLHDLPAPMPQYILRAAFYDSDAPESSHWVSSNYDDCTPVENEKDIRHQGTGIGVFTPSSETNYTTTYPWLATSLGRTAGWHVFQLVSDGVRVHMYVDGVWSADLPASGPLDKVFLRGGGPDLDVPLISKAAWDDVMVAHYDAAAMVSLGDEHAVLYTSKGFHQLFTHGTPPPPRTASSAVVYQNKVYLLGGYGTYGAYADSGASRGATSLTTAEDVIWTYDLVTKTYGTETPWGSARPSPRFDHVSAIDEAAGVIYLFGGRSASNGELLSDIWAYSIPDSAWTDLSPSDYGPSGRFGGTAVAWKHVVLVFGGLVKGEVGGSAVATNELWAFDSIAGTWSDITPAHKPAPRYGHAATMRGTQMYIYGGYDNHARFADVHKYDLDYNRWVMVRPDSGYVMPGEKSSLAAVAHEDMLLIFGGREDTAAAYSSDMWGISIF